MKADEWGGAATLALLSITLRKIELLMHGGSVPGWGRGPLKGKKSAAGRGSYNEGGSGGTRPPGDHDRADDLSMNTRSTKWEEWDGCCIPPTDQKPKPALLQCLTVAFFCYVSSLLCVAEGGGACNRREQQLESNLGLPHYRREHKPLHDFRPHSGGT